MSVQMAPSPSRRDFAGFLAWLVDSRGYQAHDLIYVVEKPWKYSTEYTLYAYGPEEDAL
jgi:hypothetical protein